MIYFNLDLFNLSMKKAKKTIIIFLTFKNYYFYFIN